MAQQIRLSTRKQWKALQWKIMLIVGIIVAATAAFIILANPGNEELDLSIIDQGVNVVVQIHDPS